MVFPSLGCITCKKRRVKVSTEPGLGCLPRLNVSSVIRPDLLAADAPPQAEAVPGDPMEIRGCYSGTRMPLLRARPVVHGRNPKMGANAFLLMQPRYYRPYLSPWNFKLSVISRKTSLLGPSICPTLAAIISPTRYVTGIEPARVQVFDLQFPPFRTPSSFDKCM
jgi:hypothetical protein